MGEPSASDETPAPLYERYTHRYPSGVLLESFYPGGASIAEARVAHLYARTEPVADSRVHVEDAA